MSNDRMERFTERSRRVLKLAQEEAENMQHGEIGTEHILLGLIREEGGSAAKIFRDAGVQYDAVKSLVKNANKQSSRSVLQLQQETKRLLEFAVDEARLLGHHFIGTEHLLMAIARQHQGKAYHILKQVQVDAYSLYWQARAVLEGLPSTVSTFAYMSILAVLTSAQQEAVRLKSRLVEPEHLLLALMCDEDGATYRVMRELSISTERVRLTIERIKRDDPKIEENLSNPIWPNHSERLLHLAYAPTGYFPDNLLHVLMKDWWTFDELWHRLLIQPRQLQEALNRAQVEVKVVTITRHAHFTLKEELMHYVNFFFPPPLRRALWSLIQNLRNKRTGKQP
jgi:ATP-dependent Clp protease ATP-binding subunit ClpA